MHSLTHHEQGFTLIELIISIFILTIAVVGIFSAFSVMVVLTNNASDRLTAAYLAQEGLEVVRNIRDSNWLDASGSVLWDDSISQCTAEVGGCEVDYTTGTGVSGAWVMSTGRSDYLRIDATNGFYNYTSGQSTIFKRNVVVTYLPGINYIAKVTVTVSWNQKPNLLNPTGAPGSFATEEYFYDWYNYTNSGQ